MGLSLFQTMLIVAASGVPSLAHPNKHNFLHKRDLVVPSHAPANYFYQGCYVDSTGARVLTGAYYGDTAAMTDESCITFCSNKGFALAGTEYSQECFCGNALSSDASLAPTSDCNMACVGNSSEACGGSNRLTVFAQAPASFAYQGCYTDSTSSRTLTSAYYADVTAMSAESCNAFCAFKGYALAGTEYSQECFCGNALSGGSSSASMGDCNMACTGNSTESCGGNNRLTIFSNGKQAASKPVHDPGPNGWTLIGCYTDQSTRTLTSGYPVPGGASNMTVALCTTVCQQNGFIYAGVEYAGECYCGNLFTGGGAPAPDGFSQCNMLCNGNSTEYCGGPNRLDMYQAPGTGASSTSSSVSITLASTSSASSSVLSSSSSSPSTIIFSSTATTSSSSVTSLQDSSSTASSASSITASSGVSSSVTSTANSSSSISSTATSSTLGYSTNSSSLTTSSSTLSSSMTSSVLNTTNSLVSTSTSSALSTSSLALSSSIPVNSTTSTSTSSIFSSTSSTAFSSAANSSSSLVSSTISSSVISTSSTSAYSANATTVQPSTNSSSTSLYFTSSTPYSSSLNISSSPTSTSLNLTSSSTSSTASVTSFSSSSSTISSTSSSASASSSGIPPGWSYKGCWIDNAHGRVIPQETDSPSLTIESCINACIQQGFSVAGAEYSTQCFCGKAIYNGGQLASADTDCNMACGGNSAEMCGAGNRLSVYSNSTLTTYPVAAPQTTALPGSWVYDGCYNEPSQVKLFKYKIENTLNNSATNCLTLCSDFGYPVGGMEYGEECYCGDPSDVTNGPSTKQPESDCGNTCSGDPRYICGGGNRLSLYRWTGTPLYTWHQPNGSAAGKYQFLIGGVVVPLMVSQTVTGKVTFVEKHGTGPPNSTGAYELDVTQVNNFAAAWRTMNGLKTDVFCSAGLTLPDKAGRQLNVGGWSGDSTFGTRLYWPGGPTNDWQENVKELSLQDGRWYPSAMVMANGTVLVVGGESGSNAGPVPTLEILPTPAGGRSALTMDWLQRTDPYNLYPFLAVLPSGGVFVAYYNEARILDESTFATTKQLPNIPGSVNNFESGRTYPLEGTAVLMPQKAPYTDPLTVLICGGSNPGAAIALDNCVSTQPEVSSPTWTLERMPSQRVMPCIATLPDGTFLILNGAHQGTAGFGLATSPNLQAVLYDPTQPVGARMSIMDSTIVARLYHSEAITLQDGRVLVSGSDPEDGTNPEEYRVEVFVPPYLLSGLPQPTYTMQNTDWAYGQSISITVTSGSTSNLRVSLLGAESSTHGNSMGQRILFPAVSCSGSTCTITAPPNAHVCPPGWFQVFILDGPTPSHSTYVRIGGDPAGLGNWPKFSDFDTPGV